MTAAVVESSQENSQMAQDIGAFTYAVVLLNMGGPDSQNAVRSFLLNLFHDPDILRLPGGKITRPLLARFIVSRRLERVKASYGKIGGGSPLAKIMGEQAKLLAEKLGSRARVVCAMRYWHPFTDEAFATLSPEQKIILLPLYPHWCSATSGSSFREFYKVAAQKGFSQSNIVEVKSYPQSELFLKAWEARIAESFDAGLFDPATTHVVFSAHGVPLSLIRKGDPYEKEIRSTFESLVCKLPHGVSSSLAFQSRVGPVRWLEPDVRAVVDELGGRKNVKTLIVVPISFTVDNLETLFELNIELREQALELGISDFRCVQAPNTHKLFVDALASLANETLQQIPESQKTNHITNYKAMS